MLSEAQNPFFDDADDMKRSTWQATLTFLLTDQRLADIEPALREHVGKEYWIPHWRLTQPSHNLADELQKRPLLSVFRFLRFTQYYVASPRCDTKYTKRTSEVFLCGQVLAYERAAVLVLVDDADIIQEPGGSYICMVAIRGYADERRRVVAVPLVGVRGQAISWDEYILGFYHGLPSTWQPPNFDTAWRSFTELSVPDVSSVRPMLARAFPVPGTGRDATVDLRVRAVPNVTSRGTKRMVVPAVCAWRLVRPQQVGFEETPVDEMQDPTTNHETVDAEHPLLTQDDALLTPADLFSLTLPPRPTPPTQEPGVGPAPQPAPSAGGDASDAAFMRALFLEQRAINQALHSRLSALSASVVSLQQQLPDPSSRQAPHPPSGQRDFDHRLQPGPTSVLAREAGGDFQLDSEHHDQVEPPRSPAGYLRSHGLADSPPPGHGRRPACSRSPRASHHRRSRSRSAPWRSRSSRSRSPRRRSRRRSRSPRRRSHRRRSSSARRHRRSRSPERVPQGHPPTGSNLFRPSPNDVIVHEAARVGPRPLVRNPGTDQAYFRFSFMSPHDRVCSILRQERCRERYRATKVMANMLYAVDFFSRPFEYFLSSDTAGGYHQSRTIVHDDAQWNGPDAAPGASIRRADQLHLVLHTIEDAASVWYPSDLVAVFRAVHGDAVLNEPLSAPSQLMNAMCNLYQAVFYDVFEDLLHGVDPRDLCDRALRTLNRDSPAYHRYVTQVMNDAVVQSVFAPSSSPATRSRSPPPPLADEANVRLVRFRTPEVGATLCRTSFPLTSGRRFPSCKAPSYGGQSPSQHVTLDASPPPVYFHTPGAFSSISPVSDTIVSASASSSPRGSALGQLSSPTSWLDPVTPGANSASPDASVAAHSGSDAGPLTSYAGPLVPVTPGAYSVLSDTSQPEVLFAAFDGGARSSSRRYAYVWCLWSSAHVLLRWEARSFAAFQTNNAMEAQGLLACLRWLRIHFPSHPVYIFGDSRVIINQATCVFVCREPSLRQWLSAIRALGTAGSLVYLLHVRRAYNVASDALCNWMMDAPAAQDITSTGDRWQCPPPAARPLSPAVLIPFQPPVILPNIDLLAHAKATWSLVVQEFESVAHLVRLQSAPASVDGPFHPVVYLLPLPPRIWTAARSLPSSFSTHSTWTCCVYGRSRCVPRLVFEALRAAATRIGVDFPLDSAFLAPGLGPLPVPDTDLRILDALVADPELGIAGTLGLIRGQTVADPRPNKALRTWLYRVHLASHPDLELLCAIAEDGLTPPWRDPSRRYGVRPVPSNYPDAPCLRTNPTLPPAPPS